VREERQQQQQQKPFEKGHTKKTGYTFEEKNKD